MLRVAAGRLPHQFRFDQPLCRKDVAPSCLRPSLGRNAFPGTALPRFQCIAQRIRLQDNSISG